MTLFDPSNLNQAPKQPTMPEERQAPPAATQEAVPEDVVAEEETVDVEIVSSPRSQDTEDIATEDDETEEGKPNVEDRTYPMAFLIKAASFPECKEIHQTLTSNKYSQIKD